MNGVTFSKLLPLLVILSSSTTPTTPPPRSHLLPQLYNGPRVTRCKVNSPELFYWVVAQPSLSLLNEETQGFFGILMDKLEESSAQTDLDPEEEEKLEKQWLYIMETIQQSLDNAMDRITNSWALLVAVSDTPALPWEVDTQKMLLKELVNDVEYQYAMEGAVVKAGVKAIVGTLQKQVATVIQQLEKHITRMTEKGQDVTELGLLDTMEQSFQQMDTSDFINKLLKRIVKKAISGKLPQHPVSSTLTAPPPMKIFFSDMMQQTAIAFEAFRQKGHIFPRFWAEIAAIIKSEMDSSPRDLSSFLHHFNSNSELFVENVFAILVSSIPLGP